MKILTVPIADLHQDPANARRHPERNLESIKASLRRFGQQTPVVIDGNNTVRKGNGTMLAARELGWPSLKVIRTDLAGVDAAAYAIADNRTSELAVWDEQVLAATLEAIRSEPDFPLEATGFNEAELGGLLEKMAGDAAGEEPPPDPPADDYSTKHELVVECRTEADQQELYNRLTAEGYPCRVLTL